MSVKLSPLFNTTQFDSNGDLLSGGKLYWYATRSTTPQNTYTDNTGATPQANPIILNSRGEPTNPIWLTAGLLYTCVLKDSADASIRTVDDIEGVNDTSITSSEWNDSGFTPTYISATSFTVPGDQTSILHVGRRIKASVTAGTSYSTITSSAYGAATTITVAIDSGSNNIDSGLSSVSYGMLSANHPSDPPFLALTGIRNLVGANNPGAPTVVMSFTCDWVCVRDVNNRTRVIQSPGTLSCTTSAAGPIANGRDQAAAFGNSNWVHFYYIFNGLTIATLSSLTAPPTVPTLPTGYTHWAYIGAVYKDAGGLFSNMYFMGNQAYYQTPQTVASISTCPTTEQTASMTAIVPSNATIVKLGWLGSTVAGGGGAFNSNLIIRCATGVNFHLLRTYAPTSTGADVGGSIDFPNVNSSQVIYLYSSSTNWSSGAIALSCYGYTMPNGAV